MLFAAATFFLSALAWDAIGRLPPCAALPCRNRTRSENLPRRLTAAAAALLLVACLAPQSVSAAGDAAVPAQEEVKAEAPAPNPAAAGHPLPVIVVRNGAEERSGRMHVKMTLRPADDQTAATQADLTATVMMAAIMAMEETRAHTVAVTLIDQLCDEMEQSTGRRPNRLGLGAETFTALKNHPAILERVKYSGGTANPATVNEHVLEIVFGIDRVVRMSAVYNAAGYGQADDIQYICDSDAALLCYATDTPAIDAPSAGYTFTWDMLNNGQFMPVTQYPGENGTHTEFIEGLMAYDMHKTADDLAVFLKACV